MDFREPGGEVMASVQSIDVGLKMIEPNWPVLCMAISVHATRALACLEAGQTEMATESLKHAAAVIEMGTTIVHSLLDEGAFKND